MGTGFSQLIPFIALPIISRYFSAESFGVLTLFVAVTAVLGGVASGRYEFAISLASSEPASANVAGVSILFSIATGLFTLVVILAADLSGIFQVQFSIFHYLIPFAVTIVGISNTIRLGRVRKEKFGSIAIAEVIRSFVTSAAQLMSIVFNPTGLSLVFGQIAGYIMQILALASFKSLKSAVNAISIKRLYCMAKRYRDFPIFSTWSILANSLASNLIILALPFIYSTQVLGYYGMVIRLLGAPSQVFSKAISVSVYRQAVTERKKYGSAGRIFRYTLVRLTFFSIVIYAVLFILMDTIVYYVLGPSWMQVTTFAKILTPLFCVRFIAGSLSQISGAFERQKIALIWQICFLVLSSVVVTIAYAAGLSENQLFVLMGASFSCHYLLLILILHKIANGIW